MRGAIPSALVAFFCFLIASGIDLSAWAEPRLTAFDDERIVEEVEAYLEGLDQQVAVVSDEEDVLWYFETGNWVVSRPLLSGEGTLFFASNDGKFYAVDASGSQLWDFDVGAMVPTDAVFDGQGRIIFGAANGVLYCLGADGQPVWEFETAGPIFSSPAIDSEGNVVFGSDDCYLYKLSSEGVLLATFKAGGWIDSKPGIWGDGNVCFSSYDGCIYWLNSEFEELARYEAQTWFGRALAVGNDGTCYAGGYDGFLYAVNSSGELQWRFDAGDTIFSSPLLTDDALYFGSNAGRVFCLFLDGRERWEYRFGGTVAATPVLGPDGRLYFGCSDHNLRVLNSDGDLVWRFDTGVEIGGTTLRGRPIFATAALGSDGTVYFGCCNGVLYALAPPFSKGQVGVFAEEGSAVPLPFSGRLEPKPCHSDVARATAEAGLRRFSSRQAGPVAPTLVDMALKAMFKDRKDLDRPTEVYSGYYIGKSTLKITEDILDDAFVGPAFAKQITDALLFEDQEYQEFVITAAEPLGTTIAPVRYNRFLSETPLQTAITEIYDRHGLGLSPAKRQQLAQQAANLSLQMRQGIALLLYAMDDASFMLDDAFERVSTAMRNDIRHNVEYVYPLLGYTGAYLEQVFDEWKKVDQEMLVTAAATVLSGLKQAEVYFAGAGDSSMDETLFAFDTPIGFVLVGGASDNIYTSETNGVRETNALIVDIGGNDRFEGKSCASTDEDTAVSVCIDLGGDDVYESGRNGSQGWGLFGIGILVDVSGDDLYVGVDHCQGASTFGVGFLEDISGNDLFMGEMMSQGAAACGIAVLTNEFGNDIYYSPEYSQGFGFTFGSGVLRDRQGDDFYFVGGLDVDYRENKPGKERYVCMGQGFGFGARRDNEMWFSGGGIGILTDGEGNDYYLGDYFAQGSSYWFSTGILDDKSGDDTYVARRYSQGAGIHNSVGVLVDEAGNDEYLSWIVGMGHGLDASVGILVDVQGDDHYSASGWYAMGAGGDGVGILIDNLGNDIYGHKGSGGLGWAGPYMQGNRTPIGIFIDAAGLDAYTSAANNDTWTKDETGVGIDTTGETGVLMP